MASDNMVITSQLQVDHRNLLSTGLLQVVLTSLQMKTCNKLDFNILDLLRVCCDLLTSCNEGGKIDNPSITSLWRFLAVKL